MTEQEKETLKNLPKIGRGPIRKNVFHTMERFAVKDKQKVALEAFVFLRTKKVGWNIENA